MIRAAAIAALAVAACGPPSRPHGDRVADARPRPPGAGLIQDLSLLATGHRLREAELASIGERFRRGTLSLDRFVDDLLAGEAFAREVAPSMLLRDFLTPITFAGSVLELKQTTLGRGNETVYYLGQVCRYGDTTTVTPWWDTSRRVRICDDSYRPNVFTASRKVGGMQTSCDARLDLQGSREECGCGPSLMRCVPDAAHRQEFEASLIGEIRDTVAHIVATDRPLVDVFVSNATFRDWNAEFYYRRWRAELQRDRSIEPLLADRATWPVGGRWAAREELKPGEHAGVLTAPQLVFRLADRRQRIVAVLDLVLCAGHDSAGATAEAVLRLNASASQFVQDGWKELAARPICTNCHARMEYGWQFFTGFPDGRLANHFVPDLQQGIAGEMYGRDLHDSRGTAPLSPRGFADHSIRQPEFARCMARSFAGHVFGTPEGDEVDTAIESLAAAFADDPAITAREMMRRALLAYATDRLNVEPPAVRTSASPQRQPSRSDRIALPAAIRSLIAADCEPCHDGGELPSFAGARLDRRLVARMLDQVAFGRMPKSAPLPFRQRSALAEGLIEALWQTKDERERATDFFIHRYAGLPVHSVDASLAAIHDIAGAQPDSGWRTFEVSLRGDQLSLTRNYAAIVSLEALASCKRAGRTGDALEGCLARALDLSLLIK